SLISSMGIRGIEQGGDAARVQPGLSIARSLNLAMRAYNGASSAWNTVATLSEFTNLAQLSAMERAGLWAGLQALSALNVHVSVPTIRIPFPKSLVKKMEKRVGPLWGRPPSQGCLGVAVAALATTMLGWDTTDIAAGYHGVDAIMKVSQGVFAVGGSERR